QTERDAPPYPKLTKASYRVVNPNTHPLPGFRFVPGFLDRAAQEALVVELRAVLARAPLYVPRMPRSGRPRSVQVANCGPLGWVTDERGYRYQATHPETGEAWPPMPPIVCEAWRELAGYPQAPECCLINYYAGSPKMGLHQDRDETEFAAPVVSLSLGETCLFRIGGLHGGDANTAVLLASGDAVVRWCGARRGVCGGVQL